MRPVHRPYLTSLSEEDVCMFLSEFEVYQSVTDSTKVVSLRLSVDPFILKSLELYEPKVKTSDSVLLNYLKSLNNFPSYEAVNQTVSRLKMNVKIPSARERMNDYLRNFLKVKEKAEGLAIPNNVFMKRFAAGIAHKGLAESLVSRINDQLLPDFKTLVKVATDEIVDHDRSKVWSGSISNTSTRSAVRDTDIAAKTCYRCHKPGHIAVNCPLRNGTAQTFDVKRSAHAHSIRELE
ncbi:hypothetical protein P9112_012153 [Eukaryota sp. TZLM1-RC]